MSVDSMILEEELDGSYEATDEEISEYAMWLGFDLAQEKQLLWIAREGLKAQLPSQWKPCRTEEDEIYYFNFDTGESTWDHPCDDFYRKLYKEHSQKLSAQRKMQQLQASSWAEQARLNAVTAKADEAVVVAGQGSKDNDLQVSECKDIVPVTGTDAEEAPGRLVVRWKSARSTGANGHKQAPEESKVKLKISDTGIQDAEHTSSSSTKFSPTNIMRQGPEYMKRREEMIQQVERQIDLEKKLLHERDSKLLERELEREREFLDVQEAQRKRLIETRRKLEMEANLKKQGELDSRKLKREEEFKAFVDEDVDSFETARRERLQKYRQSLLDKEIEVMQAERAAMSRRVREAVEGYESSATQKMRMELLEKARKTVAETESKTFTFEFQKMVERVGERVQLEIEELHKELKQRAEADMAGLRRSLLKKKREELAQQVEAMDAALRAQMERMEAIIREAYERKSTKRENSNDTVRSRSPDDLESVSNLQTTDGTLTTAMQKAACEVLLNMVLKGKPEHKEEQCCEEKFSEIKHWMAGFEKKMRTLMVTIEDTRDSFAGYRAHSRRSNCVCDGNVLMCEAFRPFCHETSTSDDPGCSSLHARASNVKISMKPSRSSPACSCEYYGGACSKPATHIPSHCKLDVETDSDGANLSDRSHRHGFRMGRHKKEKALKCKKKVKHSVETRAVPGKRCTGEDSGLQQQQKSGKGTNFGDVNPSLVVEEQGLASFEDEPADLSLSSSSSSGSSNGKLKRGKLNRLRKGLFVVKGKFLKWSAARKPVSNASGDSVTTTTRAVLSQPTTVRKGDIAKIQLECRKKLRQLPAGLRWKVSRLVRRSPHGTKAFYASADEWPILETESSPDLLDDVPPV